MCTWKQIKHTCSCIKNMEFVQCPQRKDEGMNVRCPRVEKDVVRESKNYCYAHLVKPDAPKKYFSEPVE